MTRPPAQLETPFSVFDEGSDHAQRRLLRALPPRRLPQEIDPDPFRLEIKGKVDPRSLSLADLKALDPVEITRSTNAPAIPAASSSAGGGAVSSPTRHVLRPLEGRALKTVLDRGRRAGRTRGRWMFEGLDGPVLEKTPDFAKALDLDHARDGEVMMLGYA